MTNAALGGGDRGEHAGVHPDRNPHRRHLSRQVNWWSVYEFVQSLLDDVGGWPGAGTPEWQALDDTDPAKVAGVLVAGLHWSLRIDCLQADMAQASQAVSAAADWGAISREQVQRQKAIADGAYIPRRAS